MPAGWFLPRRAWAAALVLAAALAHGHALNGPFLLDDHANIVDNPATQRLWPLHQALRPPLGGHVSFATRPLLNLSMCVDHALWGLNPRGYRITQTILHLAATLALFGLVRRTFAAIGRDPGEAERLGGAAALLWTVHPLLTAAVKYVSQRGEIGVGLFLFLLLYSLNRAVAGPRPGVAAFRAGAWLAAGALFCLLGMGSKEAMLAAPILALAYDRIILGSAWSEIARRRWPFYLALALTWWWPIGRLLRFSPHIPESGFPLFVFWRYALTQAWGLTRMVSLAVWPAPLVFDYGTELATGLPAVRLQVLFSLALLGSTVWALIRRPRLGFLGLVFFGILAPSSSLLPITGQPLAEHRMYVPLAALAVLAALGLEAVCARARRRGRPAFAVLLAAWAVALGLAARARSEIYTDELALWRDTLRKRPQSARAHMEYGRVLCERGRHEEGLPYLEKARTAPHRKAGDLANLGLALTQFKRYDEAMDCYREALSLDAGAAVTHNNMGLTLAAMGKQEEAVQSFQEALRLRPAYAQAHYNLGNLLFNLRRAPEALAHYQEASRLKPDVALNWFNLGITLAQLGRYEEAARCMEKVLQLNPADAAARQALQRILTQRPGAR